MDTVGTVGTIYCSGVRVTMYYVESLSIRKRGGHFRLTMVLSSCHVRTKQQRANTFPYRLRKLAPNLTLKFTQPIGNLFCSVSDNHVRRALFCCLSLMHESISIITQWGVSGAKHNQLGNGEWGGRAERVGHIWPVRNFDAIFKGGLTRSRSRQQRGNTFPSGQPIRIFFRPCSNSNT